MIEIRNTVTITGLTDAELVLTEEEARELYEALGERFGVASIAIPITDVTEALKRWESNGSDGSKGTQGEAPAVVLPSIQHPAGAPAEELVCGIPRKQAESIQAAWRRAKGRMLGNRSALNCCLASPGRGLGADKVREVLRAMGEDVPPPMSFEEAGRKAREAQKASKGNVADGVAGASHSPTGSEPEIPVIEEPTVEDAAPSTVKPWDKPYTVSIGLEAIRMFRAGKSVKAVLDLKGIDAKGALSLKNIAENYSDVEIQDMAGRWRERERLGR